MTHVHRWFTLTHTNKAAWVSCNMYLAESTLHITLFTTLTGIHFFGGQWTKIHSRSYLAQSAFSPLSEEEGMIRPYASGPQTFYPLSMLLTTTQLGLWEGNGWGWALRPWTEAGSEAGCWGPRPRQVLGAGPEQSPAVPSPKHSWASKRGGTPHSLGTSALC